MVDCLRQTNNSCFLLVLFCVGGDGDLALSYHEQLTKQLSAEDVAEMQDEYQKEAAQLKNEVHTL